MTSGTIHDTYAAAIRHGTAEIPDGAHLVGVVRRPMGWFLAQVHENLPALGPPDPLLDDVRETREALEADGLSDARAHNGAMDAVDFDARYRSYLEGSDEAAAARDRILSRLDDGEAVALVCYENTDEKRCHRTALRSWIEASRGSRPDEDG